MPLPSTRVIPDGWSEHHQPVAEDAMTGVCKIIRAGTGEATRDPDTGKVTPPAPTPIASDEPCRVRPDRGTDRIVEVGEQTDELRTYLVAVSAALTTIRVNDVVTLTECPNDESLVGRPLTVLDVARGTELFERDLVCSDQG